MTGQQQVKKIYWSPYLLFLTNMKYRINKPSRNFITLQMPNETIQNHKLKYTDTSYVVGEQVAYQKMHHSFGRQITEYFKKFIHWDINEKT